MASTELLCKMRKLVDICIGSHELYFLSHVLEILDSLAPRMVKRVLLSSDHGLL